MRNALLFASLLLACKTSDKAPEPAPAAPAGSGTPVAPATPPPPRPVAIDAGVAAPAAPDKAEELVAALIAEKPIAGYSVSTKTTVWVAHASIEGTGFVTTVAFKPPVGDVDHVTLVDVGEEPNENTKAAARPEIMKRIAGKGYVVYTQQAWPRNKSGTQAPLAETAIPGRPGKLVWKGDRFTYLDASGKAVTLKKIEHLPQHTVQPGAIYLAPGQDVVLLHVDFDPGSHYGEGFNHYDEVQAMELPPAR